MGLLDKAVGKAVDRHINKIKAEDNYEYNTILAPDRLLALRDRFTRTMLVNGVWYGGNDLELKQLYERDLKSFKRGNMDSEELNYFWAQPTSGTNVRKMHSGLPQLISEKMVDLIMSNGYEYMVYKDDSDEEEDKDNLQRLEWILEDNMFNQILQEAIETESWSGGVAVKLSYNKQFDYPIIEIIQPEEYEPVVKAGRIVEDVFVKYFNRNKNAYKLKEYYGVDDIGGYIKYKLFRLSGEVWIDASLNEIDETKDLQDQVFKGIYHKFSLYKPNKLPNSEFRGSRLGESDYSGSHGIFDAIDEVVSTMIQEGRDGKIKNWWPSNLLPIDPITKTTYMPPTLKKDFIVTAGGIGEKEQATKPDMTQGEIHSEKYIEQLKILMQTGLNNAGLSPQSVGITGLESTAASEESQELREKTSIRTREKKVSLWEMSLNRLFNLLLVFDDYINNRPIVDYNVKVNFNDYKIKTMKDKTNEAQIGLQGMSWDIKKAVNYVHEDMTDDERMEMRINIKIENGINKFTKEEEIYYKQMVQQIVEETPEIEEVVEKEDGVDTMENEVAPPVEDTKEEVVK